MSERKAGDYACVQQATGLKIAAELAHVATLETVTRLLNRIRELEAENAMLQDRCGPSTVVLIGTVGHYVNDAVAARIAELEATIKEMKAWMQKEVHSIGPKPDFKEMAYWDVFINDMEQKDE